MKLLLLAGILIVFALLFTNLSIASFLISENNTIAYYGFEIPNTKCSCIGEWDKISGKWIHLWKDCNNNLPSDGCETDVANDLNNCGDCNLNCYGFTNTPDNVDVMCDNGTCYYKCKSNFAAVDASGNCIEVSNWKSLNEINQILGRNLIECSINLKNNDAHCGSCYNACGENQKCINGQCVPWECNTNEDCYDGNPCTKDICTTTLEGGKVCTHTDLNGDIPDNGILNGWNVTKEADKAGINLVISIECPDGCFDNAEHYGGSPSSCRAKCENGQLKNCPSQCEYTSVKKCKYGCKDNNRCYYGYYCKESYATCRICNDGTCGGPEDGKKASWSPPNGNGCYSESYYNSLSNVLAEVKCVCKNQINSNWPCKENCHSCYGFFTCCDCFSYARVVKSCSYCGNCLEPNCNSNRAGAKICNSACVAACVQNDDCTYSQILSREISGGSVFCNPRTGTCYVIK